MGPEHLGIGDRKFLINRLIQQAPINTLVREFLKTPTRAPLWLRRGIASSQSTRPSSTALES
jgi:hypothetical protein